MSEIYRISSLSEGFQLLGLEPPKHPLIGIVDVSQMNIPEAMHGQKIATDFYMVSLKDGDCGMRYGRNYYDFNEGVLSFIGPGQIMQSEKEDFAAEGWMLFFHPDLIRQSNLGSQIDQYTFFSYEVHEALHLSKKEEDILNDCIRKIEFELEQNIDAHTNQLLVSNIELLLNYCTRFYERQFHTRAQSNKDVVSQVDQLLKAYYQEEKQLTGGTPSIQYFADEIHLSQNYLSDLLKKETGRNAKDYINDYIVEKAKTKLVNSQESISVIAYDLGFNYPHYFSRLFKQKTGFTPNKFRELHLN